MNDCKAKLLKFVEEKKLWEKDMGLLVENVKDLKNKQEEMEKELNQKGKEPGLRIISSPAKTSAESVVPCYLRLA